MIKGHFVLALKKLYSQMRFDFEAFNLLEEVNPIRNL